MRHVPREASPRASGSIGLRPSNSRWDVVFAALSSDVMPPSLWLLMTCSECGIIIHTKASQFCSSKARGRNGLLPTRVAYCSGLTLQSSALHLPQGRTEALRAAKAVRSRHPTNVQGQQSDYAAGPGGRIGGVGVRCGVCLVLGIGAFQIAHCLEPMNVADLGRGSVSLVCLSPIRWSAAPWISRLSWRRGTFVHTRGEGEGEPICRAPCRQSMPEDFNAYSGKLLV